MADDGEPSSRAALYGGGGGGGGGKFKRERKKPASTPYDRPPPPPPRRNDGWISRLVDPAKRLISGGATRFLPSFFSPAPLPNELQSDEEHTSEDHNENISVNPLGSLSSGGINSSDAAVDAEPHTSDKVRVDERIEHSNGSEPDIEELIKGKTFSRTDIDHLMEILRSKSVNIQEEGVEEAQLTRGKQKALVIEGEEMDRFQLASATPLQRPILQDAIGASPVDIARAYMGSRTSEVGLRSAGLMLKHETVGLTRDSPSKPFMSSPLPKQPICWPGAVTQNQQSYSTPQNQKSGYGIQSFPRTPYSRTLYTKSKSKLIPLRGDSERLLNISSTPLQPRETPGYGKSVIGSAQDSYRSGGPIRRSRNRFNSPTPARESLLGGSIRRSPFAKDVNADDMLKKNLEPSNLSATKFEPSKIKLQSSEVSVPSVHPHSSKLARQILEHIDRPVTLKERSTEMRLAASLKNSPAAAWALPVADPGKAGIGVRKSLLDSTKLYAQTNGGMFGMTREKTDNVNSHIGKDVASGSKIYLGEKSAPADGNDDSSRDLIPISRGPEQAIDNNLIKTNVLLGEKSKSSDVILNSTVFESHNTHRKPLLPSIAVGKAGLRNSFSSDTSAGFSFPVTTSSNTYFDLPTPTVMPSSLTSSPEKANASTTASRITIAPPVNSLPSTSNTSILNDDVAPKYKFGSGKTRLSFAVEGDDGTASSSDAPSTSYKFRSGKSRLNFGSIALMLNGAS